MSLAHSALLGICFSCRPRQLAAQRYSKLFQAMGPISVSTAKMLSLPLPSHLAKERISEPLLFEARQRDLNVRHSASQVWRLFRHTPGSMKQLTQPQTPRAWQSAVHCVACCSSLFVSVCVGDMVGLDLRVSWLACFSLLAAGGWPRTSLPVARRWHGSWQSRRRSNGNG